MPRKKSKGDYSDLTKSRSGAGVVVWSLAGPLLGATAGMFIGGVISPLIGAILTAVGLVSGGYLGMMFGRTPGSYAVFWCTIGGALLSAILASIIELGTDRAGLIPWGYMLGGSILGFLVGLGVITDYGKHKNPQDE